MTYTVLIVDDEAVQREYLRQLLPSLDPRFAVAGEASDGEEALAWLADNRADVLVTDIKMPVMDGLALCRIAYDRHPRMRRIILSGYEEFEYAREALAYKAESYLLKPLRRDAARSLLAEVADGLERERAEELAMRGLRTLSDEARRQIGRRLLQALIAGAEAEVGTLFPLAARMKIPLFEGEGLLLLLSIDGSSLRERGAALKDLSLYGYILNQIATELADAAEPPRWTLFDDRERTAVLLSGTDAAALPDEAERLYAKVRQAMLETTGLTVTGGVSSAIEDVLQLETAYEDAREALCRRYAEGGGSLYAGGAGAGAAAALDALAQAIAAELADAPGERRTAPLRLALAALLPPEGTADADAVCDLGASLLGELQRMPALKRRPERWELAWQALARRLPRSGPPGTPEALEIALREAFAPLAASVRPHAEPLPSTEDGERQLAMDIRAYIDANYAEPISLALLSDKFGASQQHISTIFHKHAGTPYIKYMTRVRMDRAARLLAERPDMKVFEVAERTGYANVKHFSYVFKKHYGVTPGEYGAGAGTDSGARADE